MALWLVRAGKYGEYEERFLTNGLINLTWHGIEDLNLSTAKDYAGIKELVHRAYPNESSRRLGNWAGKFHMFAIAMKPGDWVVLPRKSHASIAIGQITSGYRYDRGAEPLFRHVRQVKWLNTSVPRTAFEQDLLYSFGAYSTICEISRNDAEKRVRAMATNDWRSTGPIPAVRRSSKAAEDTPVAEDPEESDDLVDLAQLAQDQIARLIGRSYKGHGLARLVAAILESQGYTTHVSPVGPDKGVDILAAPDPLGFGSPRICVQVKSGDQPVERPTLDQLIGVMQNVGAEQGLLVSWSGFRNSVERETASQFFRVRLWDAEAVIDNLLAQYDKLPADLRAELPLKRIWVVAAQAEQ